MKVLIVEDEEIAAERLAKMLEKADPSIEIIGRTDSIAATVSFLSTNNTPDLILMDIHLADGSSMEIFKKVEVKTPVIFITAYDEYALQAFKVNSIDYILKPVKQPELEAALNKFKGLNEGKSKIDLSAILSSFPSGKTFQKRIVVKFGQNIRLVEIDSIAYFYAEERVNFLCTFDNKRLPVDHKLDELEGLLDPSKFFRINRQFIVNIESIEQMLAYTKSRVKLTLNPPSRLETIVSAERAAEFKDWLLGK